MALAATPVQIQGILGGSRKTPCLATIPNAEKPGHIDFMFGLECLATYRQDDLGTRNALIGMLCSAGVRLSDVARVFQVDPRQARRYHVCYEKEGLAALAGAARGRPAKVTDEIEAFVQAEFRELYQQSRRGYRAELLKRVKRQFGVTLGCERLRRMTKPIREELKAAAASAAAKGEEGVEREAESGDVEEGRRERGSNAGGEQGNAGDVESTDASPLCADELRRGFYTRYAGGLLLSVFLRELLAGTAEGLARESRRVYLYFTSMVVQMVQFGGVNLERAKGLVRREFGALVGLTHSPELKTLRRWLAKLTEVVESGRVQARLAKNYLESVVTEREVFYMDGHFGPYTGFAPFLVGYHAQAHFWVRGREHFVVSDRRGSPLFFELTDQSEDLRRVIPALVRRTQKLVGGTAKLCFVFDRGGYCRELFASFEPELNARYLTWEKNDDTDYSQYELDWHEFEVELQGNTESKPERRKLWVADCPTSVQVGAWAKRSPIRHHRKVLVRREVRGRGGVLKGYQIGAFLTNDWESTNEELARRLVARWLQENRFKMLGDDFGLDEITSYLTVKYGSELADVDPEHFAKVANREIDNPRWKKLDAERRKLRKRAETLRSKRTRLKDQGRSRGHATIRKVEEELQSIEASLKEIEPRREQEPKRINQLQYLTEEGYERPIFASKLFMDLLKVCACNARSQAAEVLKKYYENRRDHVTLLRRMLQAGGHVRLSAKGVLRVRLEPLNTEAENRAFAAFIDDINGRKPRTLGPDSHPISFELATKG